MAGREAPLPNRRQARRLVVSLGIFWGLWAVMAAGFVADAPLVGVAVVPGLAAGFLFYYTLFDVWRDHTGEPPGFMLFFGGFYPMISMRIMFTALRPSWFMRAFRATGWPTWRVVSPLAALLLLDLVLAVAMALHPPGFPHRH